MKDFPCLCGHGVSQHTEGVIGYRCTKCACALLQVNASAPMIDIEEESAS